MLAAAAERAPGADLRTASAEQLPWPDETFDAALAQLVVHFMADPAAGVSEMARVTRSGGIVAACTWDFANGGMKLLRTFSQSVRALDPEAEAESSPFGAREQLDALWRQTGLEEVETAALEVASRYEDFDQLWSSLLGGAGPAGEHLLSLRPEQQDAVRAEFFRRLGEPAGSFTLDARAWAVRGRRG